MFLKLVIVLLLFSASRNAAENWFEERVEKGEENRIENDKSSLLRSLLEPGSRDLFSDYLKFSEINAYLDELAEKYSGRVLVETVGNSYEGRKMKTITITNGDGRSSNKKVILVDACYHAREWITPATAVYVINQLVENFAENAHLLKDYDWVVLPVVNPDGYEYSRSTQAFWRKTRKPANFICIGTDPNRNFDIHWGEVGASSWGCINTFRGVSPFSEPETRTVRDIMHSFTGRAKMYLSLHSHGNYLLHPWGHTFDRPSNWKDLREVGKAGADAIRSSTGTEFKVGSTPELLYKTSGASMDYAYGKANFSLSFTMEIGTRFHPEKHEIRSLASSSWTGIKAMAERVIKKYSAKN